MKTKKKKARKEHLQWAMECQRAAPTRNLLNLASAHLRLDHTELDAKPFLLNCLNGTLDLQTGKLRAHSPEDYLTKMLNVKFDPDAQCPRWKAFLFEIFGGDQELIDFVHHALGYSITGDVSEQVFFICYGTGANGKSTLTTLMTMLLGGYAAIMAPGLLVAKKNEAHPTELADLFRIRFASTSEVKTDAKWDEERIKNLTGGDIIKARKMREDFWEFNPTHKIWISVNHRPSTTDSTYGFWRRVKMIPFTVTIPKEKQDPKLPEALKAEMPGILAWLVLGCLQWREKGLGSAKVVEMATEAYRNPQNDLEGFLAQCCVNQDSVKVQAQDLYRRYAKWCAGQRVTPLRQSEFGRRMATLGWKTTKRSVNYYDGLGLKVDSDEVEDSELVASDRFSHSSTDMVDIYS
nr:phage/plasmid primase, P4 family [uncultured Holophaga sp.]